MRQITITAQPARERFIVEGLNFHGFLPDDAEVSIVNGLRHLHYVEVVGGGVTAKIHIGFEDTPEDLRVSLFKYDENALVSLLNGYESKIVNGYMAVLREENARADQEAVRVAEADSLSRDPDIHFMRKVGHGFYGERWQAPLARDLGWPQSYLASIVSGARSLSDERRAEWRKNGVRNLRYRAEDIIMALDDASRVGSNIPMLPSGNEISFVKKKISAKSKATYIMTGRVGRAEGWDYDELAEELTPHLADIGVKLEKHPHDQGHDGIVEFGEGGDNDYLAGDVRKLVDLIVQSREDAS